MDFGSRLSVRLILKDKNTHLDQKNTKYIYSLLVIAALNIGLTIDKLICQTGCYPATHRGPVKGPSQVLCIVKQSEKACAALGRNNPVLCSGIKTRLWGKRASLPF